MPTKNVKHGSCFCGAVTFELTGMSMEDGYCHCLDCQSWFGAPVNTYTFWRPDQMTITSGAAHIGSINKTGRSARHFCKECGGALHTLIVPQDRIEIPAPLIDGVPFTPSAHVFYGRRVLPFNDGLPKFRDLPKERGGGGEMMADETAAPITPLISGDPS